jgi:ribonuclease PH
MKRAMLAVDCIRRWTLTRPDGRQPDAIRPCRITPDVLAFAEGSALIEIGRTRVLCAATIEDRVPPFLRGTNRGWITAEYAMLPRATQVRTQRESVAGRVGGRTHEIQRLIGRSLRAIADLDVLGERTLTVDCDVLQADGGTRTAAITGAYVALAQACLKLPRAKTREPNPFTHPLAAKLREAGLAGGGPLKQAVAAISAGIVNGQILLDLAYEEDSHAEVDFNVVMTEDGRFVEVQGTAEGVPFDRAALDHILGVAERGIRELFAIQQAAIAAITPPAGTTGKGVRAQT